LEDFFVHRASRMTSFAAALLSSCLLFSQQASQDATSAMRPAAVKAKTADTGKATAKKPKLTDDQKLALQLLETSEAASRGFEAPMRSYGLLQTGSSLTGLDAARARSLLGDAFRASLEIQDDDYTKARVQEEIFRTLLPLSQENVEELLPQAEMKVRKPITDIIVGRYAEKKQFDKALELVNQIAAVDEFPYGSAVRLMDAMPHEMAAEKQTLFTQAVASYRDHEHRDIKIGPDTFTGMVVRVAPSMPPKLVLQGVDEILSQTKTLAQDQDTAISVAGDGGSASFTSAYQFELFALLPILQQLDADRAQHLLEENQSLQSQLQQYPLGVNSLIPQPPPGGTGEARGRSSVHISTSGRKGDGSVPQAPVTSSNAVRDYQMRDAEARVASIAKEAESDPVQAMAHSMTLPLQLDTPTIRAPRAEALESIARASAKKNPGAAGAALAELRKVIVDLPPRYQARYLYGAGDLYLQMDDKDKADKVVSEGFKVAEKLLDTDTNPDSPNQALKAWWPSADAYRRFVELEVKISPPATLNLLKEIKDPEIRTTQSIMFARVLLGLPRQQFAVVEKRGHSTSSHTSDN
jgi:tetratricopeptide (TPR) repeat protein